MSSILTNYRKKRKVEKISHPCQISSSNFEMQISKLYCRLLHQLLISVFACDIHASSYTMPSHFVFEISGLGILGGEEKKEEGAISENKINK